MALTLAGETNIVLSVITAHQATGHRFEVDAEASLPTIRCWDFGSVEIIAQSTEELDMAASMARQRSEQITVHVPAPLVAAAHAALHLPGERISIQPFWQRDGQLRFGQPEPA